MPPLPVALLAQVTPPQNVFHHSSLGGAGLTFQLVLCKPGDKVRQVVEDFFSLPVLFPTHPQGPTPILFLSHSLCIPSPTLRNESLNNFLHRPIISDVAWHLYWIGRMLISPLAAVVLLLNLLIKLCTGGFITRYEAPQGRAVLITGCDTGFGHMLALELVRRGWKVYAGCLTPQGLEALVSKAAGSAGIMIAVPMDVTKQADIDRVVKQIGDECPQKLFALVNNAGVGRGGLVDWTEMDEYRTMMEVNFFSMATVCKAFLPLLKESTGRIVNITSLAGLFPGMPFTSAYATSKHGTYARLCI